MQITISGKGGKTKGRVPLLPQVVSAIEGTISRFVPMTYRQRNRYFEESVAAGSLRDRFQTHHPKNCAPCLACLTRPHHMPYAMLSQTHLLSAGG